MAFFLLFSSLLWLFFVMEVLTANWCEIAAKELQRRHPLTMRSFCNFFGISPDAAQYVYIVYLFTSPFNDPKYLLWLLSFLKSYEKYEICHLKFRKCNPQTMREVIWDVLEFLEAEMDEVLHFILFSFNL